jgi:hypothetical protein
MRSSVQMASDSSTDATNGIVTAQGRQRKKQGAVEKSHGALRRSYRCHKDDSVNRRTSLLTLLRGSSRLALSGGLLLGALGGVLRLSHRRNLQSN